MNRRSIIAVVSLVLLLVLAVVAIRLVPVHRTVRSFILPDGTKVSFYQVTYGTIHEAFYATDWRDHFARFVPAKYATNWGFKRQVVVASAAGLFSSNNLVVWLKRSGPLPALVPSTGRAGAPRMRATVVDENGLEATTSMSSWNGTLMSLLLPNYPRRSHIIHLRFWDISTPITGGVDQPLLAELNIPNPAPNTAPPFVAETLPAVRETNGLEVSLLKVETGHTSADLGLRTLGLGGGAATNSRIYSLAEVKLSENGGPATAWRVQGFRASAPTGTSLMLQGASRLPSERANEYYFTGALWPEEPAWDLTVELARQSDFPPEELWHITGIPVPATTNGQGNAETAVSIETNMFGVHFVFHGPARSQMLSFNSATGQWTLSESSSRIWTLNLAATNYSSDVQLGLLSLRTDTGEIIPQNGSSTSILMPRAGVAPTATYGFNFNLPDGVTNLDATFSVSKLRTATFRVKPTLAH